MKQSVVVGWLGELTLLASAALSAIACTLKTLDKYSLLTILTGCHVQPQH